MADQARELNEMMSRYKVVGGEGAVVRATSSAPRAAAADKSSSVPATGDRRSKARPWAKRTAATLAVPAADAPVAPRKQAVAAGAASESDWQEF